MHFGGLGFHFEALRNEKESVEVTTKGFELKHEGFGKPVPSQ